MFTFRKVWSLDKDQAERLCRIERMLGVVIVRLGKQMTDTSKILAATAAATTREDSLIALVLGLGSKQRDLSAQLAAAIAANDPAAIAQVQKDLDDSAASLDARSGPAAAAIAANTDNPAPIVEPPPVS